MSEQKAEQKDNDNNKDTDNILPMFESEANYKTLVCGQHPELVVWCRKVLKNKEDLSKLQEFKDLVIAKLKADCKETYKVGVSIGGAMKDAMSLIKKEDQVVIKLIMDPLPIDCKERTFVTQTLSKSKQDAIFKSLYKITPPK